MTTEHEDEKRGKFGRIEEKRAPFPAELRSEGERDKEKIHFTTTEEKEKKKR